MALVLLLAILPADPIVREHFDTNIAPAGQLVQERAAAPLL
jgi:hypothetical protein